MSFKENMQGKLKEKLNEKELELLPAGFQNLGDIIILNLNKGIEKYKKIIGKATLELYPRVKAVYNKEGEISGEFREPEIKLIAVYWIKHRFIISFYIFYTELSLKPMLAKNYFLP